MKKIILSIAAVSMALLSSCQQTTGVLRDRNMTKPVSVDRDDVTLVLGRAKGKNMGCCLLGFIPLWLPSESEAIDDMYEYCRRNGEAPEGKPRTVANTTIETRANYFLILSFPTVRATGDLIEFTGKGDSNDGNEQQNINVNVNNNNNLNNNNN